MAKSAESFSGFDDNMPISGADQNFPLHPHVGSTTRRVLETKYYFRHQAEPEIADIRSATFFDLQASVRRIADRVADPYLRLLDPDEVSQLERRLAGYTNTMGTARHRIGRKVLQVNQSRIAVIRVPYFYDQAGEHFQRALHTVGTQGDLDHLVIDGQNSTGGLVSSERIVLSSIVDTPEYWLHRCSTDSLRKVGRCRLEHKPINTSTRLTMIINGVSASATNVIAGTIQDSGRGIVIGSKSHPKAYRLGIQKFPMQPGIYLKFTKAKILMESGFDIQDNGGVDPDVDAQAVLDGTATTGDPNLDEAIQKGLIPIKQVNKAA